jgi:hypothetical protein
MVSAARSAEKRGGKAPGLDRKRRQADSADRDAVAGVEAAGDRRSGDGDAGGS